MMIRLPAVTCLVLGSLMVTALPVFSAAESGADGAMPGQMATQRPRIGLVLSGGGARGMAHVGVLQALEEMRVPVDVISGTSMGAIVGGLYASGMSADAIRQVMLQTDWVRIFDDQLPRAQRSLRSKQAEREFPVNDVLGVRDWRLTLPTGLIAGQQITLLLERLTLPVARVRDFDHLPVPFRAVATDLASGEAVLLEQGNLALALRASMAIPGVFSPLELDGRVLIDGGSSNNLPVDVARQLGADIIIAVDVSSPLLDKAQLKSVLDISNQMTGLLIWNNVRQQVAGLNRQDLLLRPQLDDVGTADFPQVARIIPRGREIAVQHRWQLESLALSAAAYRQHRQQTARSAAVPRIDCVEIDNQSRLADAVILAHLQVRPGAELDVQQLERDLGALYGLNIFEQVHYSLRDGSAGTCLVIHAREKSWGPGYLHFGVNIRGSNFEGDNSLNVKLGYSRSLVNSLGAEFRLGTQLGEEPAVVADFYQPLDTAGRYYVRPQLFFRTRNFNLYAGDQRLAKYRIRRAGGGLEVGRELGHWGRFSAGVERASGRSDIITGEPTLLDEQFEDGEWQLRFSADTLDNAFFPRDGISADIQVSLARSNLGSDSDYDQVFMEYRAARSWNENSLLLSASYAGSRQDNIPFHRQVHGGGFLRLSGYADNELIGVHYAQLMAVYQRKLSLSEFLPLFLGASLETGNVWQARAAITGDDLITAGSLFAGIDSFLGPAYLAYGRAEGGRDAFYFYLGLPF